ncbi:hypothetical protein [Streptomyces sp. NPDC053079]|uniref:hypothetical protein n=1 Tax=Streptomyces sp. NPDC053079 TaxID=3365697 RepID=UPI0037D0F823
MLSEARSARGLALRQAPGVFERRQSCGQLVVGEGLLPLFAQGAVPTLPCADAGQPAPVSGRMVESHHWSKMRWTRPTGPR